MSPRTGRPKAPEPRTHAMVYRLTDREHALIRDAAGDTPPALWARQQALAAAHRALARARRRSDAKEQ